ncbi:MAG: hypothetical protein LBJ88_04370 [Campylobacteraceae bacterium]|nr:hypothetical protein [Campylobacteraceae bacterium]
MPNSKDSNYNSSEANRDDNINSVAESLSNSKNNATKLAYGNISGESWDSNLSIAAIHFSFPNSFNEDGLAILKRRASKLYHGSYSQDVMKSFHNSLLNKSFYIDSKGVSPCGNSDSDYTFFYKHNAKYSMLGCVTTWNIPGYSGHYNFYHTILISADDFPTDSDMNDVFGQIHGDQIFVWRATVVVNNVNARNAIDSYKKILLSNGFKCGDYGIYCRKKISGGRGLYFSTSINDDTLDIRWSIQQEQRLNI